MSGYCDCGCRDCFEIAIGESGVPTLCLECEGAGCDVNGDDECRSPEAYAGQWVNVT